jgi:phosphocarrier protein FPr
LRGVAASSGIAIGPARRLAPPEPELPGAPAGGPDEERAALDEAREAVRTDLEAAQRSLRARGAGGEAEIFAAHAALLDDAALLEPARQAIKDGAPAARAWHDAAAQAADAFRALDDDYLRERAVDVEDVGRAVVAQLTGTDAAPVLAAPGIVLAGELTPREAAALDPERALAVATERGGATGHAAIVARALGIPAVVGLGPALAQIEDGTELALDGDAGTVVVAPDAETAAALGRRRDEAAAAREAALARARERVTLADGREVEVGANVGNAAEAQRAVGQGADGVGLLRTEFLFLDRATAPSEEEQVAALRAIAEALQGRRVVVRTLDAGADKPLPFLPHRTEDNPFLGVRGVRLSLTVPDLFETQLRAIARVAEEFPLAVMFPMVATLEELRAARRHLDNARATVGGSAPLEVGVMVEVPALALQAAEFAPEVDFFSVGTNDLTQYTMAADRGSGELAALLAGAQAPVLRLIAQVTEAAAAHGPWVGVCGELAGDPEAAVLLAALGVTELSMAGSRIAAVKAALREADLQQAAATLGALLGPGAAAAR